MVNHGYQVSWKLCWCLSKTKEDQTKNKNKNKKRVEIKKTNVNYKTVIECVKESKNMNGYGDRAVAACVSECMYC